MQSSKVRRVPPIASLRRLLAAVLLPLLVVGSLPSFLRAQSAVPAYFSYQGKVSNASGVLIGATNAVNRNVTFKIWKNAQSSADSDLVYVEYQLLTIFEGEFSALVGRGFPVNGYTDKGPGGPSLALAFSDQERYLGVTVDDGDSNTVDAEISPRQQMVSTGYAFRARYAEGLASNGGGTYDVGGVLNIFDGSSKTYAAGLAAQLNASIINLGSNAAIFGSTRLAEQGGYYRIDARENNPLFQFIGRPAGSAANREDILMSIKSDGNVGIGTNNPQSRLHLAGSFRQDPGNEFAIDLLGTIGGRMMVTPGGNVGIGIATPSEKLEVKGNTKVDGNLRVTGSLTYAALAVAIKASGEQGFSFTSGDTDGGLFSDLDGQVVIKTNGVDRFRVKDSFGDAVTIDGALSVKNFLSVTNDLQANGQTRLTGGAKVSGTLGVNAGTLDVDGVLKTKGLESDGATRVRGGLGYVFGAVGDGDTDSGLFSPGDGVVQIKTNGVEKVRVDGDGNVGIGNATPAAKLDVNGTIKATGLDLTGLTGSLDVGGTIAANGYTFRSPGDTDGGLYSPGDGVVTINTNNVERVRVNLAGFVGLLANDPKARLHVNGAITFSDSGAGGRTRNAGISTEVGAQIIQIGVNDTNRDRFGSGPTVVADQGGLFRVDTRSGFPLFNFIGRAANAIDTSETTFMAITSGGNVGIGTTTPTKGKLEVIGAVSYAFPNGGGKYESGNSAYSQTIADMGTTTLAGIYANGSVVANAFFAISDVRTKNVAGRSDSASDLATLMKVEVTDYAFKDTVAKGAQMQKKVVAQQVETVFPQAVQRSRDSVPDIYQHATVTDGWLALGTDLKKGERVRLVGDGHDGIHEVLAVEPGRFLTTWKATGAGDKVFVFGREVNDFRTVDYEAIAMLNVSATQEIKREKDAEVKALREQNAALGAEVAALRSQVSALATQEKARDAKLASIEKLLQSSQTVMAQPAKAATANGQE